MSDAYLWAAPEAVVVNGVGGPSLLFVAVYVLFAVWVVGLLVAGFVTGDRAMRVILRGVERVLDEEADLLRRVRTYFSAAVLVCGVGVLSFSWFQGAAAEIPVAELESEFGVDLGNLPEGAVASGYEPTLVQVDGLQWASVIRVDRNAWVVHEFTVK